MPEYTMQQHMQIGPVYQYTVILIILYQISRIKANLLTVRTNRLHGQIHLIAQTVQCNIQKTHGDIQFRLGSIQNVGSGLDQLLFHLMHVKTSYKSKDSSAILKFRCL